MLRRWTWLVVAPMALALAGCGSTSATPLALTQSTPPNAATPFPSLDVATLTPEAVTASPKPTAKPKATTKPKATPTPKATPRPKVTPEPTPEPTPPPLATLSGITDSKVEAAATRAGLDCQPDAAGVTYSGTSPQGTDLSVWSTSISDGVQEVDITALGDAADAQALISDVCLALLGSRGGAIVSWIDAHQDETVIEKAFESFDVTYRGPYTNAEVVLQPAG